MIGEIATATAQYIEPNSYGSEQSFDFKGLQFDKLCLSCLTGVFNEIGDRDGSRAVKRRT